MRATQCFGVGLAGLAVFAACGGKADAPVGEVHAEHSPVHAHHDHAHDPHHGHDHGAAVRAPTNPYVYEPRDTEAEPQPVPQGEPAGPMTFSGVSFEVLVDGKRETLSLTDAMKAERPGPIANWDCNPEYGIVNVVDFAIAEDPAKLGTTFVLRVDAAKPGDMRAGTPTDARISIRRAGEPGLTQARGIATWDPGYKSGRAVAQTGLDYGLEVRWKCVEKSAGP